MVIQQGEVYWADLGAPRGSAPAYRHPVVVVQNNVLNRSRVHTVVVCPLTSKVKRAAVRGNVLLARGEANLPLQSVVNVTQILTVDKSALDEKIGTVSSARVREILNGIDLVLEPREVE